MMTALTYQPHLASCKNVLITFFFLCQNCFLSKIKKSLSMEAVLETKKAND